MVPHPTISREYFPRAETVSLLDLTDYTHLFVEVQTKKADLTFSEASQFYEYDEMNPGILRSVTTDKPVRFVPNSYFVAGDELRLINMFNVALRNLHNSGYIDQLLDKYEAHPNTWRRVALPYR